MLTPDEYRSLNPNGRAVLKACHYREPQETVNAEYPFRLNTGRDVYHFHTRTKTARHRRLRDAAPEAYVQIAAADADRLGIKSGDLVVVSARRGSVTAPARIGDIEAGAVFVPFHYGYWDMHRDGSNGPISGADLRDDATAANELTPTGWDSISKQPFLKGGAVNIHKAEGSVVSVVRHATSRVQQALKTFRFQHRESAEVR